MERAQAGALGALGSGPGSSLPSRFHFSEPTLSRLLNRGSLPPALGTLTTAVTRLKRQNVHKKPSGEKSRGSNRIYIQVLFPA